MGQIPRNTDEQLLETVAAFEKHGTQVKAAEALGITQGTMSSRLKRAVARGLYGDKKVLPGQLLKGVSTLRNGDGEVVAEWTKTVSDNSTADLVDALKDAFEAYKGAAPIVLPPKLVDEDLLSVYPIADQHHGLLSWGEETGEDYDLKIGAERLRECMRRLVAQSPSSRQAIILNLGDWQHNDSQKNETPAHHHQLDVDSRYFKILTTGVQLMMDCIDMCLQKHEEVLVRNIPGNHDPHASIALTVALGAFYAKNPRVVVDDDPGDFFYYRFGNSLLGATHGHKLKPDKMAMHMACERAEDWGQTKFRHFYFGHIHHETAKEVGNVRVESFQTLAAKDAYSAGHGFTSGQSITSITHHRRDGEIGRHRVNVVK